MIRQPIVSVLGHIDHGKTTLLDALRGSAIAEKEAGLITQHIGATEIPIEIIEKMCRGMLENLKVKITLPGLLFIDTPGHEAFVTLRRRGGSLADIAILVIDITEGFQPQTHEALNILKNYKTPFLVAANKIDKIPGWRESSAISIIQGINEQSERTRNVLENKIYELMGIFHDNDFQSEKFDRVEHYEKQLAIVPVSAKTGEGLPELLMVLVGLALKFLSKQLEVEVKNPGKGTVLEVKEEIGLGTTMDVVIYDGTIRIGDTIVVGAREGVIVTKVRSLLKPKPMDEIKDPRFRFDRVKEAHAACGIKISAQNLKDALAGSPLRVSTDDIEALKDDIKEEIESIKIDTEKTGVILKADTLGSLEALVNLLEKDGITIRKADVGDVSKRDVMEAMAVKMEDPLNAAIMAFNIRVLKDAKEKAEDLGINIIKNNVIYKLLEEYEEWLKEEKDKERKKEFYTIVMPGKIRIIPGYIFRHSRPAIVGVEVLAGIIKTDYKLMDSKGEVIGTIKGIQEKNENIREAKKGREVAISIEGSVVGRHINEGDILYTAIPEEHAQLLNTKYINELNEDEKDVFEEIKKIELMKNLH